MCIRDRSKAYQAYSLKINGKKSLFRVAKTTGDRPGQFVTLWKRPEIEIGPFDLSDEIEFVIVSACSPRSLEGKEKRGYFVFDQKILLKKGIFSEEKESKKGKLGFRVFPPWSEEFIRVNPIKTQRMSVSAKTSQKWQVKCYAQFEDVLLFLKLLRQVE